MGILPMGDPDPKIQNKGYARSALQVGLCWTGVRFSASPPTILQGNHPVYFYPSQEGFFSAFWYVSVI